jgi:hypothetical protein
MMRDFVLSGHAVDLVLVVMVVEFGVLMALHKGQRSRRAHDLFFAFMPGVLLLLALRAALVGADWPWIALLISGSFPFHLADLARRR